MNNKNDLSRRGFLQSAGAIGGTAWLRIGALDPARDGLAELNATLRNGTHFADLDSTKQDAVLSTIEHSAFFNLMRVMTIFGFFAMSSYGGNKDNIAWDLIGFERHHGAWEYPFGYYDAEVHGGSVDGE